MEAACCLKPVNSNLTLLGALTKSSNCMLDNVLATMRNDDTTLADKNVVTPPPPQINVELRFHVATLNSGGGG